LEHGAGGSLENDIYLAMSEGERPAVCTAHQGWHFAACLVREIANLFRAAEHIRKPGRCAATQGTQYPIVQRKYSQIVDK
jgi:hypothetical protein